MNIAPPNLPGASIGTPAPATKRERRLRERLGWWQLWLSWDVGANSSKGDLGYGTSLQITVLNVHSVSFYAHFLKSNYYPELLFGEHFIFI